MATENDCEVILELAADVEELKRQLQHLYKGLAKAQNTIHTILETNATVNGIP